MSGRLPALKRSVSRPRACKAHCVPGAAIRESKKTNKNLIKSHVGISHLELLWTALNILVICFNGWKIADIQARACRSAIFERNRENVCKPLDILTRFYECLLYPRSAIFEKSWTFVQIFEYIFFKGNFCNSNLCFWGFLDFYFYFIFLSRSVAKYM